jgi:LmbE family N-acetylglucosaminyl deacetylase
MRFHQNTTEIFIPDRVPVEQALERTTHLAIAAHQDDIEIMAAAPILACFQQSDQWFTGVVVTDGRGSPRNGTYQNYSDEAMRLVRIQEQKKAAVIGEYAAQIMLDYPSKTIKDSSKTDPVEDILAILGSTYPKSVYTHNLADKHDSHVAVALRVIQAIRHMPETVRPEKVFGCEVWRGLDWMLDTDKISFDVSGHENLQAALVGVFDSQITGGKRYDLASLGRRRANATYFQSHSVDTAQGLIYGMDLTPLIENQHQDIGEFVDEHIQSFAKDVAGRISRHQFFEPTQEEG